MKCAICDGEMSVEHPPSKMDPEMCRGCWENLCYSPDTIKALIMDLRKELQFYIERDAGVDL